MNDQKTISLVIAPRRQILRDFRGNLWAIGIALGVLALYIAVSAWIIARYENWTYLHSCYFTVINVTTVGFGDVTAVTPAGKVISGVNSLAGLVLFGIFIALITLAFQPGDLVGTASIPLSGAAAPPEFPHPKEESTPLATFFRSLAEIVGTRQVKSGNAVVDLMVNHDPDQRPFVHIQIIVRGNA